MNFKINEVRHGTFGDKRGTGRDNSPRKPTAFQCIPVGNLGSMGHRAP